MLGTQGVGLERRLWPQRPLRTPVWHPFIWAFDPLSRFFADLSVRFPKSLVPGHRTIRASCHVSSSTRPLFHQTERSCPCTTTLTSVTGGRISLAPANLLLNQSDTNFRAKSSSHPRAARPTWRMFHTDPFFFVPSGVEVRRPRPRDKFPTASN